MVLKCKHYNASDTATCGNKFDECATNMVCPDDKAHTCYGVYDTESQEIKNAGCIEAPEYDNRCAKDCVGQRKGKFYYCCCIQDYCNQNYIAPPPTPTTKAPPPIDTELLSHITESPKQLTQTHTQLTWLILPIPFIIIALLVVANLIYRRRRHRSRSDTGEEGLGELDNLRDTQENQQATGSRAPPRPTNGRNSSVKYTSALNGTEEERDNISIYQGNGSKKPNSKTTVVQVEDNQSPGKKGFRPKLGQVFQTSDYPELQLATTTFIGGDSNQSKDNRDSTRNHIRGIDTKNTKILEEIGSGRYGTIRKALLTDGTNRLVAVKMLHANLKETWMNEVEIFSCDRIQHPNIIGFLGSHKVRDKEAVSYWLTLDYAANGSLYNYLCANTVDWNEFLRIALGVANGLSHLHDYDIAHRDFKSKNVLLKADLTPCVSDFGVASILGKILGPRIEPGKKLLQVGTPRYMSPEVLECSVTFTKTSFTKIDVYAMSLVLWELISRCHQLHPGAPRERPKLPPVEAEGENDGEDGRQEVQDVPEVQTEERALCPPHMLPFEDVAGKNPSVPKMRQIVVAEKQRPPIKQEWRQYPLSEFCRALEDSWEYDHDARISASCFVERLGFMQRQATYMLESGGPF